MPLCVPAVFDPKLIQTRLHVFPKRKNSPYPMLWYLIPLRLLLVVAVFALSALSHIFYLKEVPVTERRRAPALMLFLQTVALLFDFFFFTLLDFNIHSIHKIENSYYHYSTQRREVKIILTVRSSFALVFVVGTYMFRPLYILYGAVALTSLGIEWILRELCHRHNLCQIVKCGKLLIKDIEEVVGQDNCVSIPIITVVRDYSISQEKLWQGTPIASRDPTIKCSGRIMEKEGTNGMLFVTLASYIKIDNRIKEDTSVMDGIVERNKDLRDELRQQNERIFQLRTRINGPEPDCADINEITLRPPPVEPWNVEKIAGLFVSSRGDMEVFVNFPDFQEVAVHAALVSKRIVSLELERQQLEEGLQMRNRLNFNLVGKLLTSLREQDSKSTDIDNLKED